MVSRLWMSKGRKGHVFVVDSNQENATTVQRQKVE